MSGRKHHLLDDHRDMVDYRQVPVSAAVPVPTHEPAHVPALPHTDYKQTEPTPLGKERNIPHEREQVLVARRGESMSVFFQQADTGGRPIHRPIHPPIPRMPEGLGIEINSSNA